MASGPLETINGDGPFYRCSPRNLLGEAPIYRASDSTLHWVECHDDPPSLWILKVDPSTGTPIGSARRIELADSVSVARFRKNVPHSYICAYYQGVAFMDEETGALTVVKEIIPADQRDELRFNDGGIDARGRFWLAEIDKRAMAYGAGKLPESYGKPKGRLWRYDPDGGLHVMETGVLCGNGVAWSPDNKTMYFNDSVAMVVHAYDFDLETGAISNKRLIIDRRTSYGEPDGMVIDTDGNLWIAVYGSSRIMVFDPFGKHLKDIVLPAYCPTCPTWGGQNFDIIFAASAIDKSPEASAGDEGGHVFRYKPETAKGKPNFKFAG